VQYFDPSQHGAAQPGAKTMSQVTITLDREALQETMIALRERRFELKEEIDTNCGLEKEFPEFATHYAEIRIIATRQLHRVTEIMQVLQEQLGEQWI
jgi:hypothetical protein